MNDFINTIYTPVETFKEMCGKVKCPHCGESYYSVDYLTETCMHLPMIFKDGTYLSGDGNVTTTHCTCMSCSKQFSY